MKRLLIIITGLFIHTSLLSQGNTYAVVVGIASYSDPDIPQLQFANKDAEVFADFLKSKAGGSVPADNIQLLVDSQATTGAVYDAIYWLRKTCKKGDLVYFYFSGHGDLENLTMYKDGFLICYNSPPVNYVKMALSVEYLNKIANTLSAQTEANVVLITDACHSGKLAGDKYRGNQLVGEQLRNVRKKEIRITSCAENELSKEGEGWGNGRGVFSYYLINGLNGLADKQKDGVVTLDEIKNYLDSSFTNDIILKKDTSKQTPVLNGRGNFALATVDTTALRVTAMRFTEEQVLQKQFAPIVTVSPDNGPRQPQEYFFYLLKSKFDEYLMPRISLEELTESLNLVDLPTNEIVFAIIKKLKEGLTAEVQLNKLIQLENLLHGNKETHKRFNSRLAVAFDDAGQEVIDQYMRGDAAELEKRRYYNSNNNGYDVYPKMFEVAMKLIQPDNELYNILKVKQLYFEGVAIRLQIPLVKNAKPLIEKAWNIQKKAFALEKNAAYINNELGNLSSDKNDNTAAEKYYIKATEIAESWAIPWSNLANLYTNRKEYEKATAALNKAKALQPALTDIDINAGFLSEQKADLLMAEESFRKSIEINSRHFLPFERLGFVYTNTTDYALADSFFYEAAERKKGYHFEGYPNPRNMRLPKAVVPSQEECSFDSIGAGKDNIFWYIVSGLRCYQLYDWINAENNFREAIALDKKNPLAFHYLGRLLYEQKRFEEGEIILKMAIANYLPANAFYQYYESANSYNFWLYNECADKMIRASYYDQQEDLFMLALLYENWNYFTEAENIYREMITDSVGGQQAYLRLDSLLETTGRYADAETLLIKYRFQNKILGERELNSFYARMINLFPGKVEWYYKAGNFLFDLIKSNPDGFIYDKKMIDEVANSEIFVTPLRTFPKRPWQNPNVYILTPPYPQLEAASSIVHPATDAINYLLYAADLTQDDDELADINYKIGELYVWQGLPHKAYTYYQKAVDLKPANASLRLKLIDTYSDTYHYQDALAQLDTLYNRKEINLSKHLLLAKYYMQAGRFAEAETLLKDAQKIHPYNQMEITDLKGRLQLLSGKAKEALEIYKQLLADNKKDSMIMYGIGRINAKLGNKAEAWKWLEAALKNGFNYSYVLLFDPLFDSLRKSANWKILLSQFKFKDYKTATVQ